MRGSDGVFIRGVTTVRDAAAFSGPLAYAECEPTLPLGFSRFTLALGLAGFSVLRFLRLRLRTVTIGIPDEAVTVPNHQAGNGHAPFWSTLRLTYRVASTHDHERFP